LTLEKAKQNIRDERGIIDGELRISLSSDLGRNLVSPWLDEFVHSHPKVSLKLNISDSNIDFYRDSVDVALRYGSPTDSHLYGFKICNVPRVLCATPQYLTENGTPEHPNELATHNGLFYQLNDVIYDVWKLSRNDHEYKINMTDNRASNDGDLVRRWCVAGHGVAVKSCLDISSDLLSGNVVTVLKEYKPRATELWLVCPSRQSITPAIRLLRDTIKDKCVVILTQLIKQGILESSDVIY